MAIFYTDKKAKAEIADLNERIEALENDGQSAQETIESLQEQNDKLTEANAALEVERNALKESNEQLESDLSESQESLSEANAKLESFDEKVETAVQAKFESLGGAPAPASSKDEADAKQEVSREHFNKMKPHERSRFCLAGGTIKS